MGLHRRVLPRARDRPGDPAPEPVLPRHVVDSHP
nr:MAG TPA: hypothetical protein [Caudoviricetes sp.]